MQNWTTLYFAICTRCRILSFSTSVIPRSMQNNSRFFFIFCNMHLLKKFYVIQLDLFSDRYRKCTGHSLQFEFTTEFYLIKLHPFFTLRRSTSKLFSQSAFTAELYLVKLHPSFTARRKILDHFSLSALSEDELQSHILGSVCDVVSKTFSILHSL